MSDVTLSMITDAKNFTAGLLNAQAALKEFADKANISLSHAQQYFDNLAKTQADAARKAEQAAAQQSAAAAKIASDTKDAFAKVESSIRSMTTVAAAAMTGLALSINSVTSRAQEVNDSFRLLENASRTSGVAMDSARTIANDTAKAFGLTVDNSNKLTSSVIELAKRAGDVSKTSELMTALGDAAAGAGVKFSDLEDIIRQTLNGSDEGLNKLRLANPSQIWSDWAKAQNKLNPELKLTASTLTDTQKAMSYVWALLDKGNENASQAAKAMKGYAGAMGETKASVDAVSVALGNAFMPAVIDVLRVVTGYMKPLGEWVRANQDLVRTTGQVVAGVTGAVAVMGGMGLAVAGAVKGFQAAKDAIIAFNVAAAKVQARFPGGVMALKIALTIAAAYEGFNLGRQIRESAGMNKEDGDFLSDALDPIILAARGQADKSRSDAQGLAARVKASEQGANARQQEQIKLLQQKFEVAQQNLDIAIATKQQFDAAMPGYLAQMKAYIKQLKEAGATEEQIRKVTKEQLDEVNKVRALQEEQIKKQLEAQKEALKNELELKLRAVQSSDHEAQDKLKIIKQFTADHLREIRQIDATERSLKGGVAKLEKELLQQQKQAQVDATKEIQGNKKKALQLELEDLWKNIDAQLTAEKTSNETRLAILDEFIKGNKDALKELPEYYKKLMEERADLDRKINAQRIEDAEANRQNLKQIEELEAQTSKAIEAEFLNWRKQKQAEATADLKAYLKQLSDDNKAQMDNDSAYFGTSLERDLKALDEMHAKEKTSERRYQMERIEIIGKYAADAIVKLTSIMGDGARQVGELLKAGFETGMAFAKGDFVSGTIDAIGLVLNAFNMFADKAKGKIDETVKALSDSLKTTRDAIQKTMDSIYALNATDTEQAVKAASNEYYSALDQGVPEVLARQEYNDKIARLKSKYDAEVKTSAISLQRKDLEREKSTVQTEGKTDIDARNARLAAMMQEYGPDGLTGYGQLIIRQKQDALALDQRWEAVLATPGIDKNQAEQTKIASKANLDALQAQERADYEAKAKASVGLIDAEQNLANTIAKLDKSLSDLELGKIGPSASYISQAQAGISSTAGGSFEQLVSNAEYWAASARSNSYGTKLLNQGKTVLDMWAGKEIATIQDAMSAIAAAHMSVTGRGGIGSLNLATGKIGDEHLIPRGPLYAALAKIGFPVNKDTDIVRNIAGILGSIQYSGGLPGYELGGIIQHNSFSRMLAQAMSLPANAVPMIGHAGEYVSRNAYAGAGAGSISIVVTGNTIASPADENRLAEKIYQRFSRQIRHG